MIVPSDILVCFALPEEARPFRRRVRGRGGVKVLVTGMGRVNAAAAVSPAIEERRPALVLACGFAGGLDPALRHGTVVFDPGEPSDLSAARPQPRPTEFRLVLERLEAAGARRGRFECASRIAVTASEKHALRTATGADAVEMESAAIHGVCRTAGIPSVTVRVISDEANEDLPLDFNALMTTDQRLDLKRLLWRVMCSPGLAGGLLRLQRRSRAAAERLAEVLADTLSMNLAR